MKVSDIGSSFVLIAFGGFMAWQSERLSVGAPRAPGPGFFPFCLGLLLIGMGIIILVQGMGEKPGVREAGLSKGRVILAMAAIFTYSFVMESLGYLLSTFFLMLLLLHMMVEKGWWFAPATACFISLFSYILFKIWLKVLLPAGLLGF